MSKMTIMFEISLVMWFLYYVTFYVCLKYDIIVAIFYKKISFLGLIKNNGYGDNNMIIRMPVMCGIQTHARLYEKINDAVSRKSFPVELDCDGTVFTTTGFCRFLVKANKQVKAAGGSIRLTNVGDPLYDGLMTVSMNAIVDIHKKRSK